MEVHKHPHHVMHKKKWSEYLLEFFMLFLAVFLGFVAENVRENLVERRKEHHLIASLKKELQEDTLAVNELLKGVDQHNFWVDSAVFYLNSNIQKGNEVLLSHALMNATYWNDYEPHNVTVTEIRSSGNMNIIEDEQVKAAILSYSNALNSHIAYGGVLINAQHSMDTATAEIFYTSTENQFLRLAYLDNRYAMENFNFPIEFKTYDPNVFKRLSLKLEQENILENDMLGQYERIYKEDTELLKILEEQFPN